MAGSQSPVFVPRAAFDEITHLFVGRINDKLLAVAGDTLDQFEAPDLVLPESLDQFVYVPPGW